MHAYYTKKKDTRRTKKANNNTNSTKQKLGKDKLIKLGEA